MAIRSMRLILSEEWKISVTAIIIFIFDEKDNLVSTLFSRFDSESGSYGSHGSQIFIFDSDSGSHGSLVFIWLRKSGVTGVTGVSFLKWLPWLRLRESRFYLTPKIGSHRSHGSLVFEMTPVTPTPGVSFFFDSENWESRESRESLRDFGTLTPTRLPELPNTGYGSIYGRFFFRRCFRFLFRYLYKGCVE